ncbi:hypothetical protein VNO77_04378 [Canavalia gladiata]|uniref:Uncharacterized protein n=1 Tax=Canavalia gladiata TaxID=3824 RepID=A0AAN9RD47_CANGL
MENCKKGFFFIETPWAPVCMHACAIHAVGIGAGFMLIPNQGRRLILATGISFFLHRRDEDRLERVQIQLMMWLGRNQEMLLPLQSWKLELVRYISFHSKLVRHKRLRKMMHQPVNSQWRGFVLRLRCKAPKTSAGCRKLFNIQD